MLTEKPTLYLFFEPGRVSWTVGDQNGVIYTPWSLYRDGIAKRPEGLYYIVKKETEDRQLSFGNIHCIPVGAEEETICIDLPELDAEDADGYVSFELSRIKPEEDLKPEDGTFLKSQWRYYSLNENTRKSFDIFKHLTKKTCSATGVSEFLNTYCKPIENSLCIATADCLLFFNRDGYKKLQNSENYEFIENIGISSEDFYNILEKRVTSDSDGAGELEEGWRISLMQLLSELKIEDDETPVTVNDLIDKNTAELFFTGQITEGFRWKDLSVIDRTENSKEDRTGLTEMIKGLHFYVKLAGITGLAILLAIGHYYFIYSNRGMTSQEPSISNEQIPLSAINMDKLEMDGIENVYADWKEGKMSVSGVGKDAHTVEKYRKSLSKSMGLMEITAIDETEDGYFFQIESR